MSAVVETRIPDEQRDVAPTPEPRLDRRAARRLQRDVLAKMFSEFSHERLLHPAPHGDGWTVADAAGRPSWYFEATRHPLEHWEVDPASVRRIIPGDAGEEPDAQQAVLDLKDVLGLTDEMLPLYLEDLSATMYSMARRRAVPAPTAAELATADLAEVERFLDRGHPGFVASSGRVGMGASEQTSWAPEAAYPARLTWLAARRSLCTVSLGQHVNERDHEDRHLTAGERDRFRAAVTEAGEDPDEYTFLPVHPWQWEHRILPGMLPDVLRRHLILVGRSEHEWRAQQSVRTFLDVSDPARDYAKTALGVHSMGFLRGLSPAYMRTMPAVSDWLHGITREDPFLRARGIRVLREHAAVGYTGDAHHRSGVASDHTKQLAALWRESPVPMLEPGEHTASLAGVLHRDCAGRPLAEAWIERSGVTARDWVRALLDVYLVPVAHLLLSQDIALMPHSENVILRLRDGFPVGAFWKDIGEEIAVLSDRPLPEGIERIRSVVEPEQRELSIHTDVVDGVLRHLAVLLHTSGVLPEQEFWALGAKVLDEHRERFPEHWRELDLFRETFAHSCLNRLQLRNPQRMVDLADQSASLTYAGRLTNPLAAFRSPDAGPAS
ncbi:siderophore biosynthesis protein [Kocuria marina]|uniref:IucA/IucC family protein n=1 Tax=Kocuria TaxID=57493 RepID=UPI00257A5E57|nr:MULTISPECIES: IucA/IucC family protein [Kocuria]MCT1723207.1 siderophore biosynthesis protein [Kocuria marina]MCT1734604.1 siderophore biosynthesis protein [Kocuria marina]